MRSQSQLPLREWQRQFKKAIYGTLSKRDLSNLGIVATPGFVATDRLAIYQYAYRARILESLEEDFPQFAARMGKRPFGRIATAYAEKHPSKYSSLGEYSEGFPKFLKERQRAFRLTAPSIDLARREWIKVLLFNAPEPERSRVAAASELVSSPERTVLSINSQAIFHQGLRARTNQTYLIWRSRGEVRERALSREEWSFLKLIGSKCYFFELVNQAAQLRIPPRKLEATVTALIAQGIILVESDRKGRVSAS